MKQQAYVCQPYKVGNCLTNRMAKGMNSTLDEGQTPVVSIQERAGAGGPDGKGYQTSGAAYTLESRSTVQAVGYRPANADELFVRRLTPRECERLQGFPDDYTLVKYRRKPATDSPRYQSLGNSMAVPVMSWIGQRIEAVEKQ